MSIYDYSGSYLKIVFLSGEERTSTETSPTIPIVLDNVMCIGNETSLLQCSYDGYDHNKKYKEYRVVECNGKCSLTGMHIYVTSPVA